MGNGSSKIRTRIRNKLQQSLLFQRPDSLSENEDMKMRRALLTMRSKIKANESLQDHYVAKSVLGGGAFGKVYKCVHKETGVEYACKIVRCCDRTTCDSLNNGEQSASDWRLALNEIDVISRLEHPNVVKMKECFVEGPNVYVIMELLTGGDLLENLADMGVYREQEALLIFRQILEAMKYMHENGVVHCDVKMENILLYSPGEIEHIKIIDFGMAIKAGAKWQVAAESTIMGTPLYMAPEVVKGTRDAFMPPSDMWSCGVLLHILLTGEPPIFEETPEKLYARLAKMRTFKVENRELSNLSQDLINKLLVVDPKKRLTAAEALAHPWFAKSSGSQRALHGAMSRLQTLRVRRDLSDHDVIVEEDAIWEAFSY